MKALEKSTAQTYTSVLVDEKDGNHRTLFVRMGWAAATALFLATIATLAVFGFIGFLWFANDDNELWHKIMVDEWLTRAVTISTLVLRFATDVQAGIAAAMLAALVLEKSSIRLDKVAQISAMRATYPQARSLLDIIPAILSPSWMFERPESILYCFTAILLALSTTALQFSSTALLSDVKLGQLPGRASLRNASYDFAYTIPNATVEETAPGFGSLSSDDLYHGAISYPLLQARASTWLRNPPAFPAFAEYSEEVPDLEGVDDTGVLLRAFLPFADAQSREAIRNYSGSAMLLDSRVSCQAPLLPKVNLDGPADSPAGRMFGRFDLSQPNVQRLWSPGSIPFNCTIFLDERAMTMCQVTRMSPMYDSYVDNGGLITEFWNLTNPQYGLERGMNLWSLPLLVFQARNVSDDKNIISEVDRVERSGAWTNVVTKGQQWSVSICYCPWQIADMNVDMSSNRNRSEPIGFWSADRGFYTKPDIVTQLVKLKDSGTDETRGILHLAKKNSWIPELHQVIPNQIQPFVQMFADMTNSLLSLGASCTECSALLAPTFRGHSSGIFVTELEPYYNKFVLPAAQNPNNMFLVENTLSAIVHQVLEQTGSLAWAVSSLITTMSSMSYYDQMPQFDRIVQSSQVFFTTVLFPQSHLGFWALGMVLAVHVGLVLCLTIGFAAFSRHTLLGNHWQTVAQVVGPETKNVLGDSKMALDKEVNHEIKAAGNEGARVGIRSLNRRGTAGLCVVEHRLAESPSGKVMYISPPIR